MGFATWAPGREQARIQTVLLSLEGATAATIDGTHVTVHTNMLTGAEKVIRLASGHTSIGGDTAAIPERGAHRLLDDDKDLGFSIQDLRRLCQLATVSRGR